MSEITIQAWPRLLNIPLAARYLSLGESTIRDYIHDGILTAIELPGSTLRSRNGEIVARASSRKICKILIPIEELDRFVDQQKGGAA